LKLDQSTSVTFAVGTRYRQMDQKHFLVPCEKQVFMKLPRWLWSLLFRCRGLIKQKRIVKINPQGGNIAQVYHNGSHYISLL